MWCSSLPDEKKKPKKKRTRAEIAKDIFDALAEAECEEEDEMIEGAIRRKKKGRRYTGKYKGRGKYEERDF